MANKQNYRKISQGYAVLFNLKFTGKETKQITVAGGWCSNTKTMTIRAALGKNIFMHTNTNTLVKLQEQKCKEVNFHFRQT